MQIKSSNSHETLASYLLEARKDVGLELSEVAKKISIAPKYLEALEKGIFVGLPPDVYISGFLRRLAVLYDVPADALISQFKKEKAILFPPQTETPKKSFKSPKFTLTPKTFSVITGVFLVVAVISYVIWQIASLNSTPTLEITEPKDGQVIKSSVVVISGQTDPGSNVTINGQQVLVSNTGDFSVQLGVSAGQKSFKISAQNKLQSVITKNLTIIVEDQGKQPTENEPISRGVNVLVTARSNILVKFSLDDGSPIEITMLKDETRVLNAKSKILLSTNNGGYTEVRYNGKELGVLGKDGEVLTDIPFVAQKNDLAGSATTTIVTSTSTDQ